MAVSAPTSAVGPGYHTWVSRLLRRLGTELSIDWRSPRADASPEDDTGFFRSDDRAAAQRGHLRWLHAELRRAADPRKRRHGPIHLGSFPGHRFDVDVPLVTPLGPRSAEWLTAALASPRQAIDVWPWAADAMDGRYLLDRALSLMWSEVRWRAPATPDERAMLDEVLRLLRRAFPLDPALPYPWREWRQVLEYAAAATDPMAERVVSEAANAPDGPPIGYRRGEVTVLHAGWQLTVPGSWAEERSGAVWRGGEGGQHVTLSVTRLGVGDAPESPAAFLDRFAGDLGDDALAHRAGPLAGRGRVTVPTSSGVEVATLEAWSAVPGLGAAMRIEIHDPGDWEWALDLWRSLVPDQAVVTPGSRAL